jgi:lipid-A-disaccharide synthase
MKFYIISGEASGDLHGADLIRELKIKFPSANFRAWGGDLMKKEGAYIVKHYRDLAFMGFTEVLMNLRTILGNIDLCKKDILEYGPDAIILVDYPGFNLRIAWFAHEKGFPVYYYISPQVWAWKSSRVHKIKKVVRKMFVILPFETDFYKKFGYKVDYVGHPLPDVISRKRNKFSSILEFRNKYSLSDKPIIALLPGSRKQEIETILPLMLSVTNDFPDFQFVVAGAPSQPLDYYRQFFKDIELSIITDATYELLSHSDAALVTSGTATLETALLNVPEVVCYKGGRISYSIAKSLVKIKYISLVNLIMDKEVVKELIQDDLNNRNLVTELRKILSPDNRSKIFSDYKLLQDKLNSGGAAVRTANLIAEDLNLIKTN